MKNEELNLSESQVLKSFFRSVYAYMFMALIVSGFTSWYVASSGLFEKLFITENGISGLFYVVAFAPLGLAIWMQVRYHKFSKELLVFLFFLYALLIGASLSSIFLIYDFGSLVSTFFVAGGAFAAMAILGYTTSVDLSKMGSLLYMAFIGIFIASMANFFIGSSGLSFWISIIGVFVFTGLTAWEMQKLKALALNSDIDSSSKEKLTLIGGLMLYILFINLFLSLLRLLGGRN